MSILEARSLVKKYNSITAVNEIDLDIESGMIFGFLGPNGAGKSTTIKMLTTLIPPSGGTLSILDIDAIKNPLDVRKRIGVVLQQPSYEPSLTVEKSLEKYAMMWDVPSKIRKERVENLIEEFGLQGIRKKKNEDLSIGQRRRVQVAREFTHDMDLLFLDEPTIGLDPAARRKLLNYLRKKADEGLTIFYTTHVLSEAEYLCDKIAIINNGKVLTVDSPENLKNTFGKKKTIRIHLDKQYTEIESVLNIPNIKIENLTTLSIDSDQPESMLVSILKILKDNKIDIEDITVVPTTLEDIFLQMVKE